MLPEPHETLEPEDAQQSVPDIEREAQPAPAPEPEAEPAPEAKEPPKFFEDKDRLDIYDAIDAKKQAKEQEFSGDPNDPALMYGENQAEGTPDPAIEALEREATDKAAQAAAQEIFDATGQQPAPTVPPGQTVRMKVNGVERDVLLSDLVNNYQMDYAAEERLAKAKELHEQAKLLQPQPAQPGQPAGPGADQPTGYQQDAGQAQPDQAAIDALYDKAVESLQLGDAQEAKSAFKDLLASVAAPRSQPSPQELAQSVAFQVRLDDEERRTETVLREVLAQNDWLEPNPQLQGVALNRLDNAMVEDFRAGGASDQSIYERTGQLNPVLIRQLHKAGRAMGLPGFRPLAVIAPIVIEQTRQWIAQTYGAVAGPRPGNQPSPISDRLARVQRLTPQPAQRASPPARPAPPQESTSAVVDQMRQARGFGR